MNNIPKPRFHIGQEVTVKKDIPKNVTFGWNNEMDTYRGKKVHIVSMEFIDSTFSYRNCNCWKYIIYGSRWSWCEDMFVLPAKTLENE